MSRYIDAEWLLKESMPLSFSVQKWVNEVQIMTAPSIDIVRCGECIHNGSYDTDCPFGWRDGEWNMPRPCDYCSYREREDK